MSTATEADALKRELDTEITRIRSLLNAPKPGDPTLEEGRWYQFWYPQDDLTRAGRQFRYLGFKLGDYVFRTPTGRLEYLSARTVKECYIEPLYQ